MSGLIILMVTCTVFAMISQRIKNSTSSVRRPNFHRFFVFFITIYLFIFAGLRIGYNDTAIYIKSFLNSPSFPAILSDFNWDLGNNPGFKIFTSITRTFTDNPNTYLMITSAFVLIVNIWFMHKYTNHFGFSIFLFFMLGYYLFILAAIKQTIATAFSLIAIDRMIRGKKVSFVVLILLGCLFHPYCLMHLCAPVLLKQVPWKKGTWFLIAVVLLISYFFNILVRTILDVTDILGEEYSEGDFVGEGINIFRVLVYFVPVAISLVYRKLLFSDSTPEENYFINCSIMCAMIMFIGLFGNANMFARLAIYFEPPIYIAFPWMLNRLKRRVEGYILSFGAYTAFPFYFYYMTVVNKSFNDAFMSRSFLDYLRSLLS